MLSIVSIEFHYANMYPTFQKLTGKNLPLECCKPQSTALQLRAKQTALLVNEHYQNEVTLTGQNPPLKCCQPLEILTHFITGLDLSMIEIWGL